MKCKYIKPDGNNCDAFALKSELFCFRHSPNKKEEQLISSRKGGAKSKKIALATDTVSIKSLDEAISLLEQTINEVRTGKIDVKIANCVGYLSAQLIKTIEAVKGPTEEQKPIPIINIVSWKKDANE